MKDPTISIRGVYYDLTKSPYVYENAYGEFFKFSSAKKLEIYCREHTKRIEQVEKSLKKVSQMTGFKLNLNKKWKLAIEKQLYKDVEK